MAKYYGVKNPSSWQLRFDMNTGQIEIYETKEAAEKASRLSIGEVVEVFVYKEDKTSEIDAFKRVISDLMPILQRWEPDYSSPEDRNKWRKAIEIIKE